MSRQFGGGRDGGFYVPGLYERIRSRELAVALKPDPRLYFIEDPVERERAAAAAPKYSPTALGQVEKFLAHKKVKVPRWALGGRSEPPGIRSWPPFREHEWFWVGPDDVIHAAR
jgi:hypothetical protein